MEESNTSIQEFLFKDISRLKILCNKSEVKRSLGADSEIMNSSSIIPDFSTTREEVAFLKHPQTKSFDPFEEDLSLYEEIKESTASSLHIEAIATFELENEELKGKEWMKQEKTKYSHKQAEHTRKLNESLRKSLSDKRNAYLQQKLENDKRIVLEADSQTQESLQVYREELSEINQNSRKRQKENASKVISKYYTTFINYYEKVKTLLKGTYKDRFKNIQKHNENLNIWISSFEEIIVKSKCSDVSLCDMQLADQLVRDLGQLDAILVKEIEEYTAEDFGKEKAIEQSNEHHSIVPPTTVGPVETVSPSTVTHLPAITQAPAIVQTPSVAVQAINCLQGKEELDSSSKDSSQHQFVHPKRLEFYNRTMNFYTQKLESVKPLQADDNAKKYRGNCKRILHSHINTISADSPQQLQGVYDKIMKFLTGNRQQEVCINDHPLAKDFCLLTMAKKFVNDAETLVSSNSRNAFPLAKIIVSVWLKIPDFGQLLLAYFFKASPFLIPKNIPFQKGQSIQDYQKSLGYQISAEGKVEAPDDYLKRQSGIMRLYAAVMITRPRKVDQNIPHPYYVDQAWIWLSHMIRLEPLPDICSTLLLELLEFTGHTMLAVYGQHFGNVVVHIRDFYYPKLKLGGEHGPLSRLDRLITNLLKDHKIKRPDGFLEDNYW